MVEVEFASSFQKHLQIDKLQVDAPCLSEALSEAFLQNPKLRSYVLDDQGSLRKHVTIFINSDSISDRYRLSDTLRSGDKVYVLQALSGG